MNSGYLTSVFVSNAIGLVLLLVIGIMDAWRFKERTLESKILLFMLILNGMCCIIDPFVFYADGHEGILSEVIIYAGNTLLFIFNILFVIGWDLFLSNHIKNHVPKIKLYIFAGILAVAVLILIINIFVPLVFDVSEGNVYKRTGGYYVFMAVDILIMLDALAVYISVRIKGGMLKFFPIWMYYIPLVLGMVFQSVFYGISVVWPMAAVGYLGVVLSLQNDLVFRDRLTGLYNRYFLDMLKRKFTNRKNVPDSVAMMLDLNHFKNVNDGYGHLEGDEALVRASIILKEAVSDKGIVIRYAGDEFIIILNTQDPSVVSGVEKKIHDGFITYNSLGVKPYKLSVSIGMANINLKEKTVDEILNEIDARMYEQKRVLHEAEENQLLM